jgi:hypothetical protein
MFERRIFHKKNLENIRKFPCNTPVGSGPFGKI